MAGHDKPLLPEDSLEEPELAFDEELLAEPMSADALLEPSAPLGNAFEPDALEAEPSPKAKTKSINKRATKRRTSAKPETSETRALEERVKALEAESAELQQALAEARRSEDRAEHAHDSLQRRVEALQAQLQEADSIASEHLAKTKRLTDENHQLRQQHETAKAADDGATLSKGEAERLKALESEANRVAALEDRISQLQEQLLAKEKEAADLQEKLDTEAARSYRLSQRRIPVLNREIEEANEQVRELERKRQKAELTARTHEERAAELDIRVQALERKPGAAAADADAAPRLEAQLKQLSARMTEMERERATLLATIGAIDEGRAAELHKLEARADRLEQEGDQRYAALLRQRTQLRVLRERVGGMLRLAEDLSQADADQGRTLIEAIRRLAELPPEEAEPDITEEMPDA